MTKTVLPVTQGGTGVAAPGSGKSTLPYQSLRDFVNGTLITTNIDYSVASGDPFVLQLTGNTYGDAIPYDIHVQGYIYNGTIINYGGISNGKGITQLLAMNVGGLLCFWIPRQSYWQGFTVQVNTVYEGAQVNRVLTVTDVVQPANGTKLVSIPIVQSWHSNNLTNLNQLTNGPGFITAGGAPVQSVAGRTGAVILAQADVLGLTAGSDPAFNSVTASALGGFKNATYAINQRNPIWRFGNADGFGFSYFQGTSGKGGTDSIGFHFGTATATGSPFSFNTNGNFDVAGSVNASALVTLANASSKNLIVSGTANSSTASAANIAVSNGNLHIDGCRDGSGVYLGYYAGTGGVYFGNGAGGANANVTAAGNYYGAGFYGSGVGLTGYGPNFTSGNSNAINGVGSSRIMMKRRTRIMTSDGTSLNSSITAPEMGFSYGGSGENTGPFMAFGGLNSDIDYQCQLSASYVSGGNDIKWRTYQGDIGAWNAWRTFWHDGNLNQQVSAVGNSVVQRNASGYVFGNYINMTDDGNPGGGTAVTAIICKQGDDYYRSTNKTAVKAFLGITGQDVYSVRTNTDSFLGVAREIAWKNYGNGHTIIDASAGTSPSGSAINNTTPANAWSATYPTLMGWNGSSTYGVRVDSARTADQLTGLVPTAGASANTVCTRDGSGRMDTAGGTYGRVRSDTIAYGSYGSITITGTTNAYAGVVFSDVGGCLMDNGATMGYYVNNGSWLWTSDRSGNFNATGNVTAYSDERLKENWRDAPENFVARWAGVKAGTYDRKDTKQTQVGVSAQSVQAILPDAVEMKEEFLALNYGGAAAVATVELAKLAMKQAATINEQGTKIAEQGEQIAQLMKLVADLTTKFSEMEAK